MSWLSRKSALDGRDFGLKQQFPALSSMNESLGLFARCSGWDSVVFCELLQNSTGVVDGLSQHHRRDHRAAVCVESKTEDVAEQRYFLTTYHRDVELLHLPKEFYKICMCCQSRATLVVMWFNVPISHFCCFKHPACNILKRVAVAPLAWRPWTATTKQRDARIKN